MRPALSASLKSCFLASLAVFGLLGCETAPTTVGGQPRTKPVRSVVSLSPSTTELVGSLNYSGILKGRTAFDNFPMSVGSVPVVASVKPDYEKVTQVKPDLVVYDAEVFNAQDIEKIKGLGFETFVIDAKTIPDFVRQVQLLGSKVAAETNASKYADKVLESYRSAQADPIATPPSVAVLLPGEGTEHMIAGASSFVSECVKAAGGTFVGPDSDKYVSLSPEFLISENPSLIVIPFTKDAQSDAKSRVSAEAAVSRLLADGRLANVSAIKSKKILPVDGDVLLRRGYRLNTLIDDLHRRFAGGN